MALNVMEGALVAGFCALLVALPLWICCALRVSGPYLPPARRACCLRASYTVTDSLGDGGGGGARHGAWEPLRRAFEASAAHGWELGSQLVVYEHGRKVVDMAAAAGCNPLVTGFDGDTLLVPFSTCKVVAALAMGIAEDRGWIRWGDTVARHWPEFAAAGKQSTSIADIMRHDAGLPFLADPAAPALPDRDAVLQARDLLDWQALGSHLARATPVHPRGHTRCYHAITQGLLQSQIMGRVDPHGRHMGQFVEEEIARPLGVAIRVGVPEGDQRTLRIAPLVAAPKVWQAAHLLPKLVGPNKHAYFSKLVSTVKEQQQPESSMPPSFPRTTVTWHDGKTRDDGVKGVAAWAERLSLACEIPSAGMLTNARALAKVGALLAGDGSVGGQRLLSAEAARRARSDVVKRFDDAAVLETAFSAGGLHSFAETTVAGVDTALTDPKADWWGWPGFGGSLLVFSPTHNIALAYTCCGHTLDAQLGGPAERLLSVANEIIVSRAKVRERHTSTELPGASLHRRRRPSG